jgi:hypothetical protein
MNCNVGGTDRTIRLAAGVTALGLGLFGPMSRTGRIIALTVGASALFSGITRYCPINQALGINTCSPVEAAGEAVEEIGDKVEEATNRAFTA